MRRRAVLVPVGTVALILAGVLGADVLSDSGGHLIGGTGPAGATVGGTATHRAESVPADFGEGIVEVTGEAPIPRARAAVALCKAQPDAVRSLVALSRQSPVTVESLRDGLPLLEERLDEVELAAEGRPAFSTVTKRLVTVRNLWRTAVSASDAGRTPDATRALSRANVELDALATDLRKVYPGNGKDCPAVAAPS